MLINYVDRILLVPFLLISSVVDTDRYWGIQVIWVGRTAPTEFELKPWLQIRKSVVVHALHGLRQNNWLYKDVTVDQDLLSRWPDVGVPPRIIESMIVEEDSVSEREGRSDYTNTEKLNQELREKSHVCDVAVEKDQFSNVNESIGIDLEEDSFHASYEELCLANQLPGSNKTKSSLADGGQECTGSVLVDVEGQANGRDYELEVVELLRSGQSARECGEVDKKQTSSAKQSGSGKGYIDGQGMKHEPVLPPLPSTASPKSEVLVFKNQALGLLSDYDDPQYYTATFPTLFWTGLGGHIGRRSGKQLQLSFESWAKWLINHHNRR